MPGWSPGPVHSTRGRCWAASGARPPPAEPPGHDRDPGVTLESLDFELGDAYLICSPRPWAALGRDARRFLTAQTLDELAARIDTTTRHTRCRAAVTRPAQPATSTPRRGRGRGTGREERWGCSPSTGFVPALGHQASHRFPAPGPPEEAAPRTPRTRPTLLLLHADRAKTTPAPARPQLGSHPWPGTSPS